MTESKGWNWTMNFEGRDVWKNPALESYGLMNRWGAQGFREFLDLGCGLGRHSVLFAKHGFRVCSFDFSPEAVESTRKWAEEENLHLDCRVGDMRELPYEENSFDCILGWNVINHTDTEGVKKTVSEIRRVLRPGGECYLTLLSKSAWSWKQDWPLIDENTKLRLEEGPEYGIPHFFADKETLEALFREFEILGISHVEDWGRNNKGIHYHIHVKNPAEKQ